MVFSTSCAPQFGQTFIMVLGSHHCDPCGIFQLAHRRSPSADEFLVKLKKLFHEDYIMFSLSFLSSEHCFTKAVEEPFVDHRSTLSKAQYEGESIVKAKRTRGHDICRVTFEAKEKVQGCTLLHASTRP